MTLKDKRIEWKTRYDTWKQSGKSIAEWCRNEGIKGHQMYYWVRQFEDQMTSSEVKSTHWLTVPLEEESFSSQDQGTIFVHTGCFSVEVRSGANMRLLSDILDIMHNQC